MYCIINASIITSTFHTGYTPSMSIKNYRIGIVGVVALTASGCDSWDEYDPFDRWEAITIVTPPASANGLVGTTVRSAFAWGYLTAEHKHPGKEFFVGTPQDSGVRFTVHHSIAIPSTQITTAMAYQCREVGQVTIPISIRMLDSGMKAETSWVINCNPYTPYRLSFVKTPDEPMVKVGDTTHASFTWDLKALTPHAEPVEYKLYSDPSRVVFDESAGQVTPGTPITSGMAYTCRKNVSYSLNHSTDYEDDYEEDLRISVRAYEPKSKTNIRSTFDWRVNCRIEGGICRGVIGC